MGVFRKNHYLGEGGGVITHEKLRKNGRKNMHRGWGKNRENCDSAECFQPP